MSLTGQTSDITIVMLEVGCRFWRTVNCFCHRKPLESCKLDYCMIKLESLKDHPDCRIENGLEGEDWTQRDQLYCAIKTIATVTEELLRASLNDSKGHDDAKVQVCRSQGKVS